MKLFQAAVLQEANYIFEEQTRARAQCEESQELTFGEFCERVRMLKDDFTAPKMQAQVMPAFY